MALSREEAETIQNYMDARFDAESDMLFVNSNEVDGLIDKIYDDFESRTCEWKIDDESMYSTSCGNLWEFTEGTLSDNNDCKYCPYCGNKIRESK